MTDHFKLPDIGEAIRKAGHARSIWMTPQMILDMGEIISAILSDRSLCKRITRETGVSLLSIAELADKLRKEIEKI